MRRLLAALLAVLILGALAPPEARAARKRDTGGSPPPPRDSVLWIPRVAKPPELGDFLGRAGPAAKVGSPAKVGENPDRSKAGRSGSHAAEEPKAATPRPDSLAGGPELRADSLPHPSGGPGRIDRSLERGGVGSGPLSGSPAPDSLAKTPPAAMPSLVPGKPSRAVSSTTRTRTKTIPPPEPPPTPPRSSAPDSTRRGAGIGALPPARPGPETVAHGAAIVPPGVPPGVPPAEARSPAPRSPRGPGARGLAFWLFVASMAVPIVWIGIWRLRTLTRRNPRGASGGLPEETARRLGQGEPVDEASGASARNDRAAEASRGQRGERGRSRVRQMFLSNLSRVRGRLLLAALFMLGGAVVELLKPWPLKIVLDHVILEKPLRGVLSFLQDLGSSRLDLLVASAAAIVLIAVIGGSLSYLQIFITKAIGYRMVYSLRREVLSHLQRLSLSFHNRARTGDLLTTFGKDTSTLKDVFAEALLKFADHSLTMIGMLTILWFVNWKMCLLAVATLPFLCFTLMKLYRRTKLSLKKQRKQEGRVVSRVNEILSAVPLVQAFGRERYEEDRYELVSSETLRESIRMTRLEAAATRSTHSMSAIGTALVVLFGGIEVMNGRMLPGELVLVMSYLTSMYKPLRNLAKMSIEASKAAASAERIAEVLEVEPEIQDPPDAIEADHVRGGIEFAAVSFDYGDGRDVLRSVSFQVAPGQRVALVGVSGAGKSTIASLILRLYEAQRGTVLVDGVDIRRYRRESLRRRIGVVLQESLLLGATVGENIAYGKPEATMEEIVAAARTSNADEFIRELEDGYDSVVGERGVTLSAGQRQRIAIARAVIRNPRILLLDEPMRGLDAESETKVREALDRLMVNRTSLIITHDLQSIVDADQVLVLDEGAIVECGTYAELMGRNGRYRELAVLGAPSAASHAVRP